VVAAVGAHGGAYLLVDARGQVGGTQNVALPGLTGAALPSPIVGIALDEATDNGYWLVASDGTVYGIGAPVLGSLTGRHLPSPIVGIAGDPVAGGYWLVDQAGTVYAFGAPDLARQASTAPTVAIVSHGATVAGPSPS
jgi:hypothetical protein